MIARYGLLRELAETALGQTSGFDLKHQFSLPDRSVANPDRPPTTFPLVPRRWVALPSNLCSLCNRQEHPCLVARTWDRPCIRQAEKLQGRTHDQSATTAPFFLARPHAL